MGKHKAEDLHPDDVENLLMVRCQLQALAQYNKDRGLTLTDMANRVDRSHWFLNVLWSGRTWPGFWKFSTFYDLCKAVGALPTVRHDFSSQSTLLGSPKFIGAGCQQILEDQRVLTGMSVEDVAKAAGVAKSAPWRAENSEDPRLSTLQRYARVYDGSFRFGVVL